MTGRLTPYETSFEQSESIIDEINSMVSEELGRSLTAQILAANDEIASDAKSGQELSGCSRTSHEEPERHCQSAHERPLNAVRPAV